MPRNLSLMLMDIDWDKAMPAHFILKTAQDVWNTLVLLFPLFAYVSILIRPSSSSGIYNTVTGAVRSMFDSWHVYIVVYNSTVETNKNFVEFLKRRAWMPDVNLGYATLNGAGVCERYFNDFAVHSAERVIAVVPAKLEVPLAKKDISSLIFEGGALDLASIDYNLEPDYRDTYAQEKAKLITTIPVTDKSTATIGNQDLATSSKSEEPIYVSEEAKGKIIDIFTYLQNTPNAKTYAVKAILNTEVVSALVVFLGYDVDYNNKFKLRDEKTPSCSISYNGYIKDFGGDFAGGVIDFIMHIYSIDFNLAWFFFKACFGQQMPPLPNNLQGVLPAPISFEKRIKVKENIIGQI